MTFEENADATAKSAPKKKITVVLCFCAAVIVLLAVGIGLFLLLRPNTPEYTGLYILSDYADEQTTLYTIYNKQLVGEPILLSKGYSQSTDYNEDRSAYFHLHADRSLYLMTPQGAGLLMKNVERAKFSNDGKSLFILCEGVPSEHSSSYYVAPFTLKRYDIAADSYKVLATDVGRLLYENKSGVVYLSKFTNGVRELRVVNDNGNRKIMESSQDILCTNDDFTKIFVRESAGYPNYDYVCYDQHGNRTVLFSGYAEQYQTSFNRDYSQMLIYSFESGAYICEFGKEPVKISNSWAELVSPFHDTYYDAPIVDDFYGQLYRASRGESTYSHQGWIINRNLEESIQLTPSANFLHTDPSGEYVYYLDGHRLYGGDFRIAKISDMADAHKNSVLLTNDTADFDDDRIPFEVDITSDGSIVYYTSGDKVYSVDGRSGGTPKLIASGIDRNSFKLADDDVLYYQIDSDLYAYDGQASKLMMEDAEKVVAGVFPYAIKDGSVYALSKGNAPEYLFDLI